VVLRCTVGRHSSSGPVLGGGHDRLRLRSTSENVGNLHAQRTVRGVWTDDGLRAAIILPQRQFHGGRPCRPGVDPPHAGQHPRH